MSFRVVSKAGAAGFNSICSGFVPLAPSFLLACQAVVQLLVSEVRIFGAQFNSLVQCFDLPLSGSIPNSVFFFLFVYRDHTETMYKNLYRDHT